MHADYHKDVYDCTISIWTPQGECVKKTVPEWRREGAETSAPDTKISFIKQRPVFTKMLYDQCVRLGIEVLFSHSAQGWTETDDGVVIETASGQKFEGDVCVAADGIGSTFDKGITGSVQPVLDSGYAAARMAFPRSVIPEGSEAARLLKTVDQEPEFRTYLGDDLHLILFLTKDYVAFTYTHEVSDEAWHVF